MIGIKSFEEGRTEVENVRRLHFLQGNLWPASFGNLKAPYSAILLHNNELSTQLIRSFVKTE
jgi:hypothetical protein